jgi:hypothetical protein
MVASIDFQHIIISWLMLKGDLIDIACRYRLKSEGLNDADSGTGRVLGILALNSAKTNAIL